MSKLSSPLRDRELMEMLSDEPELLAIADALVQTRDPRHPDMTKARNETASRRARLPRRRVVAGVVVAIALLIPALALSGVLGPLFGFSNHGTPVPHKGTALHAFRFPAVRPGTFVKLASRNGIAVYAARRKTNSKLCFSWSTAGTEYLGGTSDCMAPASFPSPSQPVWDMSNLYSPPPYFALHQVIGVAADGVRSVEVLAASDCHPIVTVPVIDNVYIDMLKPMTGEAWIVARDSSGNVVWHTNVIHLPSEKVLSCGLQ